MDEAQSLSEFITSESLTKHLGVTRNVLLGWLDHGLPYIRVGRQLYFREGSVAAWLARQENSRERGQ